MKTFDLGIFLSMIMGVLAFSISIWARLDHIKKKRRRAQSPYKAEEGDPSFLPQVPLPQVHIATKIEECIKECIGELSPYKIEELASFCVFSFEGHAHYEVEKRDSSDTFTLTKHAHSKVCIEEMAQILRRRYGHLPFSSTVIINSYKHMIPWSQEAVKAVGWGGKRVPFLIRALKDEDAVIRQRAIEALGKMGPDANAAVPALIEALKEDDAIVRQSAAEALKKIQN